MSALSAWELHILDWIAQNCRTDWLDAIVPFITSLGNYGWLWILLALVFLVIKRQRPYGVQLALALILSLLLCNCVLKPLADRVRPFELAGITELLVALPKDPSFPSGHTSASFAAATVLIRTRHPLRWPVLILAFLIAFSRLYLYAHFPTDVLAGAAVGIVCGLLATLIWDRLIQPRLAARKKTEV